MTITLSGRAWCSKRAMEAMRLKVRAPLSQMRTSASAILATAACILAQASSSSRALPESISTWDTPDSEASERLANSAWDISSENTKAEPSARTAISSARRLLNFSTGSSINRESVAANFAFSGFVPFRYCATAAGEIPAASAIFFWVSFSSFFFARKSSLAAKHSACSSGVRGFFLDMCSL
ncbi:hypothetical protein D9M71_568870 [compost metagenome]